MSSYSVFNIFISNGTILIKFSHQQHDIVCTCLLTVSLMTVLQDESQSSSCPVPPLRNPSNEKAMIIVDDRSTELALMDHNFATCLVAFDQGRRFLRLVAYIYTPSTVKGLQIQISVSGVLCTDSRLVVYHEITADEYGDIKLHQCTLSRYSARESVRQECEFECYNICPMNSVVRVYVQVEKWLQEDTSRPLYICDIGVTSYHVWKASNKCRRYENWPLSYIVCQSSGLLLYMLDLGCLFTFGYLLSKFWPPIVISWIISSWKKLYEDFDN